MLCQLRTIGVGIGVLAICLMLQSASWQIVLLGFAAASIAWAMYSCSQQLSQANKKPSARDVVPFERRQQISADNLYRFPAQTYRNQSSGY